MRGTTHISVSSTSFSLFLYSIRHYSSHPSTFQRDDRHASTRSATMVTPLPEGGMRGTTHISVSSSSFPLFLHSIRHYSSHSSTSRRDDRHASTRSATMVTPLPEGGYERHHIYFGEFIFVSFVLVLNRILF
jgi:hypothetical protein